jgi:prenyltransferase beta subunit
MSPNDSVDLSIKDEEFRVDAMNGLSVLINREIDTCFSFWLLAC